MTADFLGQEIVRWVFSSHHSVKLAAVVVVLAVVAVGNQGEKDTELKMTGEGLPEGRNIMLKSCGYCLSDNR